MKKMIVFSMLILISAASFSQQTKPSEVLTKQDYLQKSKHQKTAAWLLLGGGAAFTITGYAILVNSANYTFFGINTSTGRLDKGVTAGEILFFAGDAAMLGSIPLFIASHRNMKKSMSLSFKNETAPQIQKTSFVYRPVPSLTLKLNL
jgi:hypothetical protein